MADTNEDQVLPVEGAEGSDEETISASAPVTTEEDQAPEKGSDSSEEVIEEVEAAPSISAELKDAELPGATAESSFAKPSELPEPMRTGNPKPTSVDNIEVEFTHSVKFMHAGQYYDYRGGEKAKVSNDLYKILWERGCIKPIIR
jgi:hypothetical protein